MKYKHIVYLIALGLWIRLLFWEWKKIECKPMSGCDMDGFGFTFLCIISVFFTIAQLLINGDIVVDKIIKPIGKFLNRKMIDK